MKPIMLDCSNFKKNVEEEKGTVLVDFWAPWCAPCRMMEPVIDELAEALSDVKVCKVNVEDNPELAEAFGIMSIPCLMVFRDGKVQKQSSGVSGKDKIIEMLKSM